MAASYCVCHFGVYFVFCGTLFVLCDCSDSHLEFLNVQKISINKIPTFYF